MAKCSKSEKGQWRGSSDRVSREAPFHHSMKIAYCLPDQQWIDEMRGGAPEDAAHIQQGYIADGLRARGHSITYLAPPDLSNTVFAHEMDELTHAPQTWTGSAWFELLSKIVWRLQGIFGIPYLNVFSN